MKRRDFGLVALVVATALGAACAKAPIATPDAPPRPPTASATPAPPPAPPAPAAPAPVAEPSIWERDLDAINAYLRDRGILSDIYFDYDQWDLRDVSRRALDEGARFMRERPEFVVAVEGHADERGSSEYNVALGERRATAASGYLGALGVASGRLRTVSYGKERPTCRDPHEDCWQRNRRAHLVVVARAPVAGTRGVEP